MKFKAKITFLGNDHIGIPPELTKKELNRKITFVFSKNKIWFTKHHDVPLYFVNFFGGYEFSNGTNYTFTKIYDANDKKKWQVNFTKDCKVIITLNQWNKIKCNLIHKRYWLQQEKYNWLKQVLIAGTISIVTYFIGQSIGFNKGYENGLKAGKEAIQQSNQQ